MNTAAKGRRNEYRSMQIFEKAGYECMRSAASKGVWDFVASGKTDIVFCQVRTRDWPSAVEIEAMQNWPAPTGARRLIHRWRVRQRLPDVRTI